MADKPASRPIAKPLPHPREDGFAGQFALPGLVPDYVRDQGKIARFDTQAQADYAALKALFNVLLSRTTDTRSTAGYRRMTAAEFAQALNEANITPTYFAELYGVAQARVMGWLDGQHDIPHSVNVFVRLLANDEVFKKAAAITVSAQQGGRDGQ